MISCVVPAYNEEALLEDTLKALFAALDHLEEPFEVIVVDDASTDRTATIALEHGARVLHVENRQIAATRNAGGRAAKGEMLIFVDADTIVNGRVIRGTVEAMRSGAVGGGCFLEFEGRLPVYARILVPLFLAVYRMLGFAGGGFLFCTKAAFDAVGGFDETLYATEEVTMTLALRRQGRFVLLRDKVITSGRKLRTYSAGEVIGTFFRIALKGPKFVKDRKGLDLWYRRR
jgi:glycosyltransferase involved in cell wall biosynthesis